jgi:hypothetical protein
MPVQPKISLTEKNIRRLDLAFDANTNDFKKKDNNGQENDTRQKEGNERLTGTLCIRAQNLTSQDAQGAAGNMYFLLIMFVLNAHLRRCSSPSVEL